MDGISWSQLGEVLIVAIHIRSQFGRNVAGSEEPHEITVFPFIFVLGIFTGA